MTGKTLTKELALTLSHGQILHHKTLKQADKKTPVRARVNGAVRLLKRQPDNFTLPMKHGLSECFYIIEANADQWELPC